MMDTYGAVRPLPNGVQIPGLGFGTWQSAAGDITVSSVRQAIRAGYRNIDTAAAYHNEKSVGEGIRQAMAETGVRREELFVSTKLWNDHRGYDPAMRAFETSVRELGLDYLDLYLIHWPAVRRWHADWRQINASTWRAFETLYRGGQIRAIGVSNFLTSHLQALLEDGGIAPMVDQIEYHPGFGQTESAEFCRRRGIAVEAWSPLGTGAVLKNGVLAGIAKRHGKSAAQICLRWLLQKGIIPLPKSVQEEHIRENARIFDFRLSGAEMRSIDEIPYCGGMRFDPDAAQS